MKSFEQKVDYVKYNFVQAKCLCLTLCTSEVENACKAKCHRSLVCMKHVNMLIHGWSYAFN